MREDDATVSVFAECEMDDSWGEDGVRDATETSERANRCHESMRGDFFFFVNVSDGGGAFRRHGGRIRSIRNDEIGRNRDFILHGREFAERTVGRSFVAKIFGGDGGRSAREEFEDRRVARIVEEGDEKEERVESDCEFGDD